MAVALTGLRAEQPTRATGAVQEANQWVRGHQFPGSFSTARAGWSFKRCEHKPKSVTLRLLLAKIANHSPHTGG
jgi:hypothetical protein